MSLSLKNTWACCLMLARTKKGNFKYLKNRVWGKVKGWMEKILSYSGREVLIKSVVQAIPVYSMSGFRLPRGLCENIASTIRQFWWGCKNGKRSPAWVSWDAMTLPKHLGGLGFRDMEIFNLALLSRQAWRILTQPNTLSARLLKDIYFPNTNILNAHLGSHPSQIWRAVLDGRDLLWQGLIRRVGDRATTGI